MKTVKDFKSIALLTLSLIIFSNALILPANATENKKLSNHYKASDDATEASGSLQNNNASIRLKNKRKKHSRPPVKSVVAGLAEVEAGNTTWKPPQFCVTNQPGHGVYHFFTTYNCTNRYQDPQNNPDPQKDPINPKTVLEALGKQTLTETGITTTANTPLVNEPQTYQLTKPTQTLTVQVDNQNITVTLQAVKTVWKFPHGKTLITNGTQKAQTTYTDPTKYNGVATTTFWTGYFTHPQTGQNIPLNGIGKTQSQTPPFRIWAYPITLTDPNKP